MTKKNTTIEYDNWDEQEGGNIHFWDVEASGQVVTGKLVGTDEREGSFGPFKVFTLEAVEVATPAANPDDEPIVERWERRDFHAPAVLSHSEHGRLRFFPDGILVRIVYKGKPGQYHMFEAQPQLNAQPLAESRF